MTMMSYITKGYFCAQALIPTMNVTNAVEKFGDISIGKHDNYIQAVYVAECPQYGYGMEVNGYGWAHTKVKVGTMQNHDSDAKDKLIQFRAYTFPVYEREPLT